MTARDTLCERFYHMELEKIKEQESLLAKFQHSQGGGSSGTPIEENKKTLEQDSGRPR
jgi:hypothetical protein